jgi:hypothetical protein
MNVKLTIRTILIQSALTQVLIFAWNFYEFQSLEQAAISATALVLFIGLYGGALSILLLGRVSGLTKMVIVSFLTAVLVTLTFVIYPVLGLVVEWYVLFGLLFMSGLIAYGLSWEPRRQSCEQPF